MVPPACKQESLPIEQLDREHVIRNIKSQRALMWINFPKISGWIGGLQSQGRAF